MCEFGLRVRRLFDLQRGRLGRRGRQLATTAASRPLSLPRPVSPLSPLSSIAAPLPAVPLPPLPATYRSPDCPLNILDVLYRGPASIQTLDGQNQNNGDMKKSVYKQMCKQFSYAKTSVASLHLAFVRPHS